MDRCAWTGTKGAGTNRTYTGDKAHLLQRRQSLWHWQRRRKSWRGKRHRRARGRQAPLHSDVPRHVSAWSRAERTSAYWPKSRVLPYDLQWLRDSTAAQEQR